MTIWEIKVVNIHTLQLAGPQPDFFRFNNTIHIFPQVLRAI